MKTVLLRYHWEPSGWWAESRDLPGFSAAAETFDELRLLAFEGVRLEIGESVVIAEELAMRTEHMSGNPGLFHADLTMVGG